MSKEIETRKQKFDQAYFGWVKFEIESSVIPEIKNALNANINILRSLVVKTVRENTMSYTKVSMKKSAEKTPEEEGKTEAEVKGPVNEDEIDKSIDELVIS
jgi:ribosomal protein S6